MREEVRLAIHDLVPPVRFSSPVRYLLRMGVFLALIGFLAFILQNAIRAAFDANPGLNGLILGVLAIGIVLALRQVLRLFREIAWAKAAASHPVEGVERPATKSPVLLAPMAAILRGDPRGARITPALLRSLLDSLGDRLEEGREILRYLAGLLVFLGLLGTFWGLLETVGSIGKVIGAMRSGADAAALFDELKAGLAAPLAGMGISFSSSLFGLAGSLVLGFLDLQAGQANRRFYAEVEDWLAHRAGADGLEDAAPSLTVSGNGTQAMANLAEGVQALVHHMRQEQQMVRDWIEAQAAREKDLKRLLEQLLAERAG